MVVLQILGCDSKVVIASWSCPAATTESQKAGASGGASGVGGNGGAGDALEVPWSTGFENGFCDYQDAHGGSIQSVVTNKTIVTEPVRSGSFAAAFSVKMGQPDEDHQVRCIRQGTLPVAAYYGVWYYIPALTKTRKLWNLIHFGGDNPANNHHLWDVSLINNDNGDLQLVVFSYLTAMPDQSSNPPIPIGSWFHIEIYLKRATDKTGTVIVYQDNTVIFRQTNIVTDNSSGWGQWFVGNLATDVDADESTVYVDDVTISETR